MQGGGGFCYLGLMVWSQTELLTILKLLEDPWDEAGSLVGMPSSIIVVRGALFCRFMLLWKRAPPREPNTP